MTVTISATMVKELREKTGAGMMDAKKALVEAEGNMEKASELLRQKGILSADKKSGRSTAEGQIFAKRSDDEKVAVLLEVNCETDFVARGDMFQALVEGLAQQALQSKAKEITGLLKEKALADSSLSVADYVKDHIGVIKENLQFKRFTRYSLKKPGLLHAYIHTGNKIGVLIELHAASDAIAKDDRFKQLAKDITLHIASSAPEFLSRDDIPKSVIEAEKRIEMGKEDLQKKPLDIREKIVMGRLDKILAQRVLLDQPFVKDPGKTIQELVDEQAKELGGDVTLKQFVRYLLGDEASTEKKQEEALAEA